MNQKVVSYICEKDNVQYCAPYLSTPETRAKSNQINSKFIFFFTMFFFNQFLFENLQTFFSSFPVLKFWNSWRCVLHFVPITWNCLQQSVAWSELALQWVTPALQLLFSYLLWNEHCLGCQQLWIFLFHLGINYSKF